MKFKSILILRLKHEISSIKTILVVFQIPYSWPFSRLCLLKFSMSFLWLHEWQNKDHFLPLDFNAFGLWPTKRNNKSSWSIVHKTISILIMLSRFLVEICYKNRTLIRDFLEVRKPQPTFCFYSYKVVISRTLFCSSTEHFA
jgi:hypothetical protein